jgi:hypothetical protein
MVEEFLRNEKKPIEYPSLRKSLPKNVMHQTLKITLWYLWKSKKIEYTPEGIVWRFEDR